VVEGWCSGQKRFLYVSVLKFDWSPLTILCTKPEVKKKRMCGWCRPEGIMYKNESMGLATRRLSSFLCHHPVFQVPLWAQRTTACVLTATTTHTHTQILTHTLVDFRSEKDGARMESFLVRLFLPSPPPLLPPTTTLLFPCKGEETCILYSICIIYDYDAVVCVCKEEKAGKKTTQSSTAFHRSRWFKS